MKRYRLRITWTLFLIVVFAQLQGIALADSTAKVLANARVDSIASDLSSIQLTECPEQNQTATPPNNCAAPSTIYAVYSDAKQQIRLVHQGDHVKASINAAPAVTSITVRSEYVGVSARLFAMVLAWLATFMLAALLTRGHPLQLIIGQDNRYSNSQFQIVLWFSVLIASYLATLALRFHTLGWDFWDGIDIPPHLFALSGLSALTYGAAKGITTSKVQAAVAAGNPDPKPSGTPRFLLDLVSNDKNGFDLGDFQMLVVTLLAVAMYVVATFGFLALMDKLATVKLPDVDTTILSAFGLGQGAYLTKKAAGNPGTS